MPGGSSSIRTIPLDDPLTSHTPFQPCAPQPKTRSRSSVMLRTDDRGTRPSNPQLMWTLTSVGETSTQDERRVMPSTAIALFAPVNRIGKRAESVIVPRR